MRAIRELFGASTALLTMCLSLGPATARAQEARPNFMGRAFLFEPDLVEAVDLGWLGPGYSKKATLEQIRQSLTDRLRRSGKFVEAVVSLEMGDVFAVTFVGRQSEGFEDMVIRGLSAAGRLTLHVVASGDHFEACDSTEQAEAAKLEAWRDDHADLSVGRFNHLAEPDGGPCAAIQWLSRRSGGMAADGGPLAVLREPAFLFRTAGLEKLRVAWVEDGSLGPELTLLEEEHDRLRSFAEAAGATAQLAFAFDGEVTRVWQNPVSFANPLLLVGGWDLDSLRPVIFSFAGEPLAARLRFLEVTSRELPNVQTRDTPTTID